MTAMQTAPLRRRLWCTCSWVLVRVGGTDPPELKSKVGGVFFSSSSPLRPRACGLRPNRPIWAGEPEWPAAGGVVFYRALAREKKCDLARGSCRFCTGKRIRGGAPGLHAGLVARAPGPWFAQENRPPPPPDPSSAAILKTRESIIRIDAALPCSVFTLPSMAQSTFRMVRRRRRRRARRERTSDA